MREREGAGGTKEATVHVPPIKYSLASVQLRGNPLEYSRCLRQWSDAVARSEAVARMRTNSSCMVMMLI